MQFLPTAFAGFFIVLYGSIYRKIAFYAVNRENHRFEQEHENSLIMKLYVFEFVNSYFGLMYYSFFKNQFFNVTLNLISIQAFKQVAMNVIEFFQGKFFTQKKINKATKRYEENTKRIEESEQSILVVTKAIENEKLLKSTAGKESRNVEEA